MKGRWFILFKGFLMMGGFYILVVLLYFFYNKVFIVMLCFRNGIFGYYYYCVKVGLFFGRLLLVKVIGFECIFIVLYNFCYL